MGTTEITAPLTVVVNEKASTSAIRSMIPLAERLPAVAVSGRAVAIVPPWSSARKPSPPAGSRALILPAITAMSSCRLLAELAGWPMNHLWTFWA